MATTVQFVDSIVSSPTVRLNINDGVTWAVAAEGIDLSPPQMKRATVGNMLSDEGEFLTAAAFSNRTVKLPLRLIGAACASADAAATSIIALGRELNRPTNILKVQLTGMTAPVFFNTYRASDYTLNLIRMLAQNAGVVLEIPAAPFAVGLKETVSPITVSNDPAAGSNGCFFDVANVKGDVATPLILKIPTTTRGRQSLFATRQHGTPANMPFLLQAESMNQVTDTATQANNAAFSGAGNNYSRVSFATVTALTERLRVNTFPASPDIAARGRYRVFMRCRKNGATSTITVKFSYGSSSFNAGQHLGDVVTIPGSGVIEWVEVGDVTNPIGDDPITGSDAVELQTEGLAYILEAQRVSGSDTLDVDCFVFMPADEATASVAWQPIVSGVGTADRLILDGQHNAVYGIHNATGDIASMNMPYFDGVIPLLKPGVTNRIFFLNEILTPVQEVLWPTTWSFEPFYHPRYLFIGGP